MDDIRIQIVNYKTKKYLIECLGSLQDDLETFKLCYCIAILDNSSGEDLSDIRSMFPRLNKIEIYQGTKNLGFGGGHNFLSQRGETRFLLFLNPDIRIIEEKTVERLMRRIEDSKTQVIGPRLITSGRKTQLWDHGELHGWKAQVALNSGHSYWQEQEAATEAAWVSGAAFLIQKRWFDDLNGFDENYFLYKEEEDLCWRLRSKGGKILYDPKITLFHYGGVVAKRSHYLQQSIDYFIQKHLRKDDR